MPGFPFIDGILFIATVDLSDWLRAAELRVVEETVESARVMGQATKRNHKVISDWELTARLTQDFASGAPHQTLNPIKGTTVAWRFRPTSAAISTTNPEFQGNGILIYDTPLAGAHGDEPEVSVRIIPAGAANDLVVDTTP